MGLVLGGIRTDRRSQNQTPRMARRTGFGLLGTRTVKRSMNLASKKASVMDF